MGWNADGNKWIADDQAWSRAGGRRRYNTTRRVRATLRRFQVFALWWQQGLRQSEIARRLQMHPSTISREVRAIYIALQRNGVSLGTAIAHVPPRRQW